MCRVRAKQRMAHVLRTLLTRVVTLGMRMKLLLLDRGFDSVRVIQDLIACEWPCIMPAVKRGKKPTTAGGPPAPMPWLPSNKATGAPLPCRVRKQATWPLTWQWSAITPGDNGDGTSAKPCCRPPGVARIGP